MKGKVIFNRKIEKSFENIKSFKDLGVKKRNHQYQLSSGVGRVSSAFFELEATTSNDEVEKSLDLKLKDIPSHVIRYALSLNPFFYFDSLERYFPSVGSAKNFINQEEYLGGLEVTFTGTSERLKEITHKDYLLAINSLLNAIETEIKGNLTLYEGSDYTSDFVHKVFKDKDIKVARGNERENGQEELVANEPWYVYNANYGTSEEKSFVSMFARRFELLGQKFKDIYLIRNEREIKIFDAQGRAFEPDFVLFCKQKENKELTYQVFIEPKGAHLLSNDKWKEDFLEKIRNESKTIKIDTDNYLITGVPFYNNENENEFKNAFEGVLGLK